MIVAANLTGITATVAGVVPIMLAILPIIAIAALWYTR